MRAVPKQNEAFILGQRRSWKAEQKAERAVDLLPVVFVFQLYTDQLRLPPFSCHSESHLASSRAAVFLLSGVWTLKAARIGWTLPCLVPAVLEVFQLERLLDQQGQSFLLVFFLTIFFLLFFFLLAKL